MSDQNVTEQPETRPVVECSDLLAVMGVKAPAKQLTALKTGSVMARDGSSITGFVITDKNGHVAIIDKSACRWLTKEELWWLMHESKSPLMTANKKSSESGGRTPANSQNENR